MSNSPLVSYTRISPNKTSPRNHVIDTITIHCMAGQLSAESCGSVFATTARQASSNYGIGFDGKIGMYVEEKDRSWCSSNGANDHRAITIEVASDRTHPYKVTNAAYASLINLLVDICKRNNIKKLLWQGDPKLIGQVDKQNMTVHRWFAKKACPGDYLYNLHPQIAADVNKRLGVSTAQPVSGATQPTTTPVKPSQPAPSEPAQNGGVIKTVKITTHSLNIRSAPGTEYMILGVVKKGDICPIVEVSKNNWGRLQDGRGWISLKSLYSTPV